MKEARQLWEYCVSDVIVQVVQGVHPDTSWRASFIEKYLEGRSHLEVTFRILDKSSGQLSYYCAILERHTIFKPTGEPSTLLQELCPYEDSDWRELPMLVTVGEAVQHGEPIFVSCVPSVIRLKRLDFFGSLIGHKIEPPSNSVLITGQEDRELDISYWPCVAGQCVQLGASKKRKLPDQVIETGSEIMNEISKREAEIGWQRLEDFEPQIAYTFLRVLLGHNSVWPRGHESDTLRLEPIEVVIRPFQLIQGCLQCWHRVYSAYGEQIKTENPQGSRDSSFIQRGVHAESQKGSKGRRITASPPEEELTQTKPALSLGEYTAKRIHLGTLEDA